MTDTISRNEHYRGQRLFITRHKRRVLYRAVIANVIFTGEVAIEGQHSPYTLGIAEDKAIAIFKAKVDELVPV